MRDSIKRLKPQVHTAKTGRGYSRLPLGNITRVEDGGYKLDGPIFATSDMREGMHAIIEQLMERVDEALEEALREDDRPE